MKQKINYLLILFLFLLSTTCIESTIETADSQSQKPADNYFVYTDINIEKALYTQTDLIDQDEHCSADPDLLIAIGAEPGQQVRIRRIENNTEYLALYTISELQNESSDFIIRMGKTGRERLGTDAAMDAEISITVVHPNFTTEQKAKDNGEFIELLSESDNIHQGLIVIAPHAGSIEYNTHYEAERVYNNLITVGKNVSAWRCLGYNNDGSAFDRWHITSTDINEVNFPHLNTIIDRNFTYAISFHGWSQDGILIGGNASEVLKNELKDALVAVLPDDGSIVVSVASPGESYGGTDPDNIVNRLCNNKGIQLEQSYFVRETYGDVIADAVSQFFENKL